jgi:TonB family protein
MSDANEATQELTKQPRSPDAAPSAATSVGTEATSSPSTAPASTIDPIGIEAPKSTSAVVESNVSPTPVNEVVPEVPRSALQTIRGTIRVAIRVTIDRQGAVSAATTEERGPSRYFERLSTDAAKQWRFEPSSSGKSRNALLRFNFTRDGASARQIPSA